MLISAPTDLTEVYYLPLLIAPARYHILDPMQILIASNNQHKIEELRIILPHHQLIPVGEIFEDFDPKEHGSSFLENSLIKARALSDLLNSEEGRKIFSRRNPGSPIPPVLADDSGIMVDALDGAPGIYSARFGHEDAGRQLSPPEQNDLLLEKLEGRRDRSARYICCMTLMVDHNRVYTAQEPWEGEIATGQSRGTGGFGYDPIFYLPERGCTVADLSADDKRALSHRGKATMRIAAILASL